MSQLGFDEDGDPIDLPPTAVGWRVRRMTGRRGAPGLVYGSSGVPLVIPLEMDIEDLRREVGQPGRYRLEPVDERHRQIKDVSAAIVVVPAEETNGDDSADAGPSCQSSSGPNAYAVVMEAMRQNQEMARTNAEIARMVVDRFPAMLESAAVLLKAADGAGLPAREPRKEVRDDDKDDKDDDHEDDDHEDDDHEDDDHEDDDHEDQPAPKQAPMFDLNAVIAHLAPALPVLLTALTKGELKLSNLAEMLGNAMKPPTAPTTPPNTKAAPVSSTKPPKASAPQPPTAGPQTGGASTTPAATFSPTTGSASAAGRSTTAPDRPTPKPQAEPTTAAAETPRNAAPEPPAETTTAAEVSSLSSLSPQVMAHFLAIQCALTPEEGVLVRAAASELSPRDLHAWIDELSAMTVPEAVERVRALLARMSTPEAA